MSLEAFREATKDLGKFLSVPEVSDALDERGFWTEGFYSRIENGAKHAMIRHFMKNLKDEAGFPLWASVVYQAEDGTAKRVYKQETLFNLDDYRQVITYNKERSAYHREMAERYIERAKRKYPEQTNFNWD